jgi:hypothetical protein
LSTQQPHPLTRYPLTRKDFAAATRVIQRLIDFRDAEDGRPQGKSGLGADRSGHLRRSLETLELARDFWASPEPEPRTPVQPRRRQAQVPRPRRR